MASAAFNSFGTLLQMGDGATPENFTTVAEVLDIIGFGYTRATHDVTSHSSTSGYEEMILSGVKRSKQFSVPHNLLPKDPTQDMVTGVLSKFDQGTKVNWRLTMPNAGNSRWAFAAYIMDFLERLPVDGPARGEVALKPTGVPVLS